MGDSYNNNLSSLAIKRIIADKNLVELDKQNYKDNLIFFKTNPSEVDNLFTILVIGSNDVSKKRLSSAPAFFTDPLYVLCVIFFLLNSLISKLH